MTVDDSSSMRQMVSFILKDAGYDVLEAKDGREALSKLSGAGVQMVITDLNMPFMNGLELMRALRADTAYRFVPVVFLTTESKESIKQEARAAGATAWIRKPFKLEQLLSVIKRALG